MYILEVLRETIWIWLSAILDIVLYIANIIPIEAATDCMLFIFVTTIIYGIRDIWY